MRRERIGGGLLFVLFTLAFPNVVAAGFPPCLDDASGGGAASPPVCFGDCPPETTCMLIPSGGASSGGGASATGECGCVPIPTPTPTGTPTSTPTLTPTATATATPTPTPTIPKMTGEPCADPSECESENCVDQFCCNTPCDETGQSCAVPGSEGTCVGVTGAPAASSFGAAVVAMALLLLGCAALAGIPRRRRSG
jgi:hypothetical protein